MKDVLKYLRQTGGFTQADAARMLGVSRQSYSKYENGTVIPSDAIVSKAAEVYGVDESFIRANKVPLISGSNVEYKLDNDANVLEVASPEYDFTDASQKKSYDAYFDGNIVRVIGESNFYEGQRFKLVPLDDSGKRNAAWEDLQDILSKHDPLVMPSDKDPFYKEMLKKAVEEKHGYFD
ncbi:MAG: helix-turn-helix transcriptional regulator [Treponema sp.]|nr:helix-turn-helix transcriptional regulator [Treponema sp.]